MKVDFDSGTCITFTQVADCQMRECFFKCLRQMFGNLFIVRSTAPTALSIQQLRRVKWQTAHKQQLEIFRLQLITHSNSNNNNSLILICLC